MPKAKSRQSPVVFTIEDFDMFWAAYPRKVAKGEARKAFESALKKVHFHGIMAAIELQRRAGLHDGDPKFIPHPATWLRAERWSDEIIPRQRPIFRNGALELLAQEAEMWPEPIDGAAEDMRYLGAPDA